MAIIKNCMKKKKMELAWYRFVICIFSLQDRVWGSPSPATLQHNLKQIAFRLLVKIRSFVVATVAVDTSGRVPVQPLCVDSSNREELFAVFVAQRWGIRKRADKARIRSSLGIGRWIFEWTLSKVNQNHNVYVCCQCGIEWSTEFLGLAVYNMNKLWINCEEDLSLARVVPTTNHLVCFSPLILFGFEDEFNSCRKNTGGALDERGKHVKHIGSCFGIMPLRTNKTGVRFCWPHC